MPEQIAPPPIGTAGSALPLPSAILDPDPASSERLRRLLFAHPSIDIVDCPDSPAGIDWAAIRLLFCDLDRDPKPTLALLGERPPAVDVILLTSSERWAAKAFEADALDFLIKPVEKERLGRTIRRLLRLDWAAPAREVEAGEQVFVPFERGRRLISINEICAIHAVGNYTQVLLAGGGSEIVLRPLRRWEETLAPGAFLRIHRSTLANARRLRRLEMVPEGDGALAEVAGLTEKLAVSRRCLTVVRSTLSAARPPSAGRSSENR
jgi:two-component system LytT family response regulator